MNRLSPIILSFLIVLFTLQTQKSNAAVTVTPAAGLCLNVSPGAYSAIGNIVIDEINNPDFAVQTNTTIILTAPVGFQFQVGAGSVSFIANRNISAATIAVTAATITVTITVGATNKGDVLTISGINARATIAGSSGNILRTGGSATIAGDASGAGVNHGTLTASQSGVTYTTAAAGNWSAGATWVGGVVPGCAANVLILHSVTANVTAAVTNLTINTGGTLNATNAITVTGTFAMNGTGAYIHNNATDASTTIFAGTESFAPTSSITVLTWYNSAIAFPTSVSGNFGNVTLNEGSTWSQDGLFAPAKIKGTLTISSGAITMDDGTGMTTALTLQDVVMNGSGSLRMATGAARNLTLVTGNYTDFRTSGGSYSGIQFNCPGSVSWTVNGNVNVNVDWSYYEGTGASIGNSTVVINGNLNISGGKYDFNRNVDAALDLTVTGNINITGNPGWVRFMDRNTKNLTVTATNFNIGGGIANTFMGGSSPTGNGTFNISNDIVMTGASTTAYFVTSTINTGTLTVNAGRDVKVTDGDLRFANTNGSVDLNVSRNIIVNNSGAELMVQNYPTCNKLTDVSVNGYLQVNSGVFYGTQGIGNLAMTVVETVDINNGQFYGTYNLSAANTGTATLTCNDINLDGGKFSFMNSSINDGKTVQVNVNNDIIINFLSASDIFTFIALAGINNPLLDLNVTNNVTISGNFAGSYFLSSAASGNETVDIGGSMTVNAGDVFFVGNETTLVNTHAITTNITGNLNINGGTTRLTTGIGTATINVTGNVVVTGGTLNLKYDTGVTTMNITGAYTQSNGTFNLHSRAAATTDIITVNVNDNFSMTNGTLNFDNMASAAGQAEHILNVSGANYTMDGSAIITHANNLTANYIFGQIFFKRAGTTVYLRNTNTNDIRHVKYTISAATTVDASTSPNGFEMTSIVSNVTTTHNSLTVNGILDMGSKILSCRQNSNYYSRVTVNSGGRYRTSNVNGLYSGSNVIPSSINGYCTTFNRVGYTLDPNSTVEYYGTATSVITGIPNGYASGTSEKYGKLEINFTGAAGSTWVYPETDNEVFVRTSLILTNGEFNLDNDHVTTGGGRSINIETGGTITRTNGFIRSETSDATALLRWNIASNGTYIVPFGYDAANYIPFTFQQTSGAAGITSFATYRTAVNNTPLPPTVTHVRNVAGADNSANTVDRFWLLTTSAAANANLTFKYVASEGTGIVAPKAQRWEPVTTGWYPPAAGQSNPTGTSTLVGPLSAFNTWWTLAASSSPLPVELVLFDVKKNGDVADINWKTASEINNASFTVEKSKDGVNFEYLTLVQGAGNSTSLLSYETTDKNPFNGINYYRLKQTDFDGKFSYSEIKTVTFGKTGTYSVYPNPVTSGNDLTIHVPGKGLYKLSLTESTGRLLYFGEQFCSEAGDVIVGAEKMNFSPGIYQLTITSADDQYSQKIMIRK